MIVNFYCDEMYPVFGITENTMCQYSIDVTPEFKEEFEKAEKEYLRVQDIVQGLCWKR